MTCVLAYLCNARYGNSLACVLVSHQVHNEISQQPKWFIFELRCEKRFSEGIIGLITIVSIITSIITSPKTPMKMDMARYIILSIW